jgi:tetratricopeptide (TPR) repeat protein
MERLIEATATLQPPGECMDEARLRQIASLTDDPARVARIEALRVDLASARVRSRMGERGEALKRTHQVAVAARELSNSPLLAEALVLEADLTLDSGDAATAERDLTEAELAATASGPETAAMDAAIGLVRIARRTHRPEVADSWAGRAKMHLDRLKAEGVPAGEVARYQAALDRASGDTEALVQSLSATLESERTALGPSDPRLAAALTSLAVAENDLGHYSLALQDGERALAFSQPDGGTGAADLVRQPALDETGRALLGLGRYAEAQARYEELGAPGGDRPRDRARRIRAACGAGDALRGQARLPQALDTLQGAIALAEGAPDGAALGRALRLEGTVLADMNRGPDATQALERAQAALESSARPNLELGLVWSEHGRALRKMGHPKQALDDGQRAVREVEAASGARHPVLAGPLLELGLTLEAAQRPDEAIPPLERVLTLVQTCEVVPEVEISAKHALARALRATRRDLNRARQLTLEADARAAARSTSP